jgi:hypothetical protein
MILLSSSNSIRRAFHVAPIEIPPAVSTAEWYRFWRVDAKKFKGLGEVMLFTNHETLYTLVADSSQFKRGSDFVMWFLFRYAELFGDKFDYNGRIKEEVMVHRGVDRSVIGVMNSFFFMIECAKAEKSHSELELWLNRVPVVSRNLIPEDAFNQKIKK